MTLSLEHASNPDIPGYWEDPVDPKQLTVEVSSFEEARQHFVAWRDRNHLGGGNMTRRSGQLHDGNRLLGHFSYNARFWAPDGSELTSLP